MTYSQNDEFSATRRINSIATVAGVSLALFIGAGVMVYALSGDRPATTATGFQPVVDSVRPVPSTTGQGGGGVVR